MLSMRYLISCLSLFSESKKPNHDDQFVGRTGMYITFIRAMN